MCKPFKSNLFFCSLLLLILSGSASGQTWEIFDQEFKLVRKIQNGNLNILGTALRINTGNQQLSLLSQEYESFITIDDTRVYQYLEPWIIVSANGKFGALHEYGDLVYRTEYDRIESYFNLLLGLKGRMLTVYDRGTKETRTLGPFDSARFGLNGQLMAKTPLGYYLPLSDQPDRLYEDLQDVNEDVIIAREHTGYGLVNRDGKYILDPIIDTIEYLGDNHFYAHDGNQHMLIKAQTNNADIKYTSYHRIARENDALVEYIHGKLRRVMKNDGILLDAVGMTSVQKVNSSHYNIAFRDGKLGLLNPKGSWDVQPTQHIQWLQPGNQGLYGARIMDKYGYVDAKGEVVIPAQFEGVKRFSEGMAGVKNVSGWGYINLNGEELISAQFDEVGDFFRGFAIVKRAGKSTIINKEGVSVLKDAYDRICLTDDNYYLTENEGKYGMVNPMGQEITLPVFDEIRREEYDKILVGLHGRYGVIKENGDISLPLFYDSILFDPITKNILAKHNAPPIIEVAEDTGKKKKKGA
ncbi:MAG TPA: WG repeat-containing protein [Lunatimonas sp.]|nr:WG repeat-containing protein [Lunatimonas sp.]